MKRRNVEDARWTKKHGKSRYAYKTYVHIGKHHKLMRNYQVTESAAHDSQVFDALGDGENGGRFLWADSAYRSKEREQRLREAGYISRIQREGISAGSAFRARDYEEMGLDSYAKDLNPGSLPGKIESFTLWMMIFSVAIILRAINRGAHMFGEENEYIL